MKPYSSSPRDEDVEKQFLNTTDDLNSGNEDFLQSIDLTTPKNKVILLQTHQEQSKDLQQRLTVKNEPNVNTTKGTEKVVVQLGDDVSPKKNDKIEDENLD